MKIKGFIMLSVMVFFLFIQVAQAQLHNTTALDNADNIYEYAVALNPLVDNYIGVGILLMVFMITFVISSGRLQDIIVGFGAGSFITALSATILLPLELIGFKVYTTVLLITGISVFAAIILKR